MKALLLLLLMGCATPSFFGVECDGTSFDVRGVSESVQEHMQVSYPMYQDTIADNHDVINRVLPRFQTSPPEYDLSYGFFDDCEIFDSILALQEDTTKNGFKRPNRPIARAFHERTEEYSILLVDGTTHLTNTTGLVFVTPFMIGTLRGGNIKNMEEYYDIVNTLLQKAAQEHATRKGLKSLLDS